MAQLRFLTDEEIPTGAAVGRNGMDIIMFANSDSGIVRCKVTGEVIIYHYNGDDPANPSEETLDDLKRRFEILFSKEIMVDSNDNDHQGKDIILTTDNFRKSGNSN